MKLLDALQDWRQRQKASGYDPRKHRSDLADQVFQAVIEFGYRPISRATMVSGPLGGESEQITVEAATPAGPQRFKIMIYANGVFDERTPR